MATLAEIRQQYPQYEDMTDRQLADALHKKFYSDMPRQEFDQKVGISSGQQYNAAQSAQHGLMQGMTMGWADEILGTMMTPIEMGIDAVQGKPFDPGRSWQQAVDRNRQGFDEAAAANPEVSTIANIAGSVGTGIGAARGGLTLMNAAKPTAASMGTRAALEGAAYGALSGAGQGETADEKMSGAAWGGALGAGMGGILGGAGGTLANKAVQGAVPAVDDLKSQAGAIYDAAKNSGVTFSQPAVKQVADSIAAKAITEGIDPTLHPGATAALKRLQEAATSGMTVQNAQTIRRVLAAAGRDPMNPDQARIASMMVRDFDAFVGQSVPELAGANALYSQAKKGQLIEEAIQRARDAVGANYSAAGMDTALRQQFRSLLNNSRALRGFSEQEIAAIRRVVEGGPVQNFLRLIGKAAPTGAVSFGAAGGVPFMVGNAIGGPALGATMAGGVMGAGFGARSLASGMSMNNAQMAAAIARSGGKVPQLARGAIPGVTQALTVGAAGQAPQLPRPQLPIPMLRVQGLN